LLVASEYLESLNQAEENLKRKQSEYDEMKRLYEQQKVNQAATFNDLRVADEKFRSLETLNATLMTEIDVLKKYCFVVFFFFGGGRISSTHFYVGFFEASTVITRNCLMNNSSAFKTTMKF
jgi:hypothetical protein